MSAFLAPAAVLLLCYFLLGFLPFGDKSLLIMDMSNQYVEFYAGLRDILAGKTSVLFSWNIGFGTNLSGLVSYYLSSPFSVVTALFPNELLPLGITVLTVLKIGLCGLTFCVFLQVKYHKIGFYSVAFAIMYALCGYAVGYAMCLMWLDSMIWLPFIILSLERVINGKSPVMFIALLFLEFVSNYYTAYMVGIFCVLYFVYYSVSAKVKIGMKTVSKFVLSAVLAGGMSAFLILPTLYCMLNGKLGDSGYTVDQITYYNPLLLISKLMNQNSYDAMTNVGTPFVYIGLFSVLMLTVFFVIKGITLREKLASAGVMAFIILTSVFAKLDLVWHAFKYPNWFPFRYMFVFAFFALMCAYKAFLVCAEKESDGVISRLVLSFSIVCILFLLMVVVFSIKITTAAFNIAMVAAFAVLVCLQKAKQKPMRIISAALMLMLCIFDVASNTVYIYNSLDEDFSYDSASEYSAFKQEVQPVVDYIKSSDDSFYRVEKTFERSKNDAFGLNLNGIGHYSSAYDRNTNSMLKGLGFAQDYFWCSYLGSTPLTDSIFGVKYVLSYDDVCSGYTDVFSNGDVTAFENPYALPIGCMASSDVKTYSVTGDPFNAQNELISSIFGENTVCFSEIQDVSSALHNCQQLYGEEYRFLSGADGEESYISLDFKSDGKPVYAYFPNPSDSRGSVELFVNGEYVCDLFTSDTDRIIYLGTFDENETVNVTVSFYNEFSFGGWEFYSLDLDKLGQAADELKSGSFNVTDYSGRRLKGTVTVSDERTTMFTSIRYDDGWSVYIDGEKCALDSIDNTLLCFDIPAGTHTVELKYTPEGLYSGILISVASFLILAFIVIVNIRKNKNLKS